LPLLLLVATAAGGVLTASVPLMQCLVFWLPRALGLCEDLFNMFLMTAVYPQHPYGFMVRMLLFTLFPTALVSYLPVEAVRDADPLKTGAMIGAAFVYAGLATGGFGRGLGAHPSGHRILESR